MSPMWLNHSMNMYRNYKRVNPELVIIIVCYLSKM